MENDLHNETAKDRSVKMVETNGQYHAKRRSMKDFMGRLPCEVEKRIPLGERHFGNK